MRPHHIRASAITLGIAAILAVGCSPRRSPPEARFASVTIAGKAFNLEVADTDAAIDHGLGGRSSISPDGGMLFVFPDNEVRFFVMRDCPIPLDLIYLDDDWRIISVHSMQPEPPRGAAESPEAYDARLKSYSSDVPARRAIEIRGGVLDHLAVKTGDAVRLDAPPR